jgi:hypothetical protein
VRKDLEAILRHKVFKMLLSEGKITEDLVRMLMSLAPCRVQCLLWSTDISPRRDCHGEPGLLYHPGFFLPGADELRGGRPDSCLPTKDGAEQKVFDALEWLAAMCSHVPDKGEQILRYYGCYSNVSGGKRDKQNQDGLIPCILDADVSKKRCQKNWARLIRKMYEVLPLFCPK